MPESSSKDNFTRYVILLSRTDIPFSESLIRRHVEHLRELARRQQLVMCGPFTNYSGGMIIIKASSLEEAHEIAKRDPFIIEGAETCEIRTWQLSCEENNHLGMG
ncbi:MAG: hypothetical protein HYV97_06095 [Bdellovibrio sp.]|nr:hypothetical protein [Bdellovibrio sp.]